MGKASRRKRERRDAVTAEAAWLAAVDQAIEQHYATLERYAAQDAMLVACEGCGLEQVQPPSPADTAIDGLPPAGTVCVVCGCETATFVGWLRDSMVEP